MADSNRIHEVTSPLPPRDGGLPALLFRRMTVQEGLSKPFRFDVELLSEDFEIDANKLLGEPMTIKITIHDRTRYFSGLVSEFRQLGREGNYSSYHCVLRPWFWFLSRTANCRMFQDMDTFEIFEEAAKNTHSFSDYENKLSEQYTKRKYCVQYRESDFHFLSRLLEEEGIFYFFEHEEDKHTMVLGDAYDAFKSIDAGDDGDTILYRMPGEAQVMQEHISGWQVEYQVRTGNYVTDEYDFTKPRVDLEATSEIRRKHSKADYEVYDYPGRFPWTQNAENGDIDTGDGERYARVRVEELQVNQALVKGVGDHREIKAGHLFTLDEYPREDQNKEHVFLEMKAEIESAEVEQMRQDAENRFEAEFVACLSDVPYRPRRRTRKPVVRGPQTAVVVGKSGEEIWTDKYGRVKVQFHWDREGKSDENSSCWIRVSQSWAGKAWGGIQIPRIGQEVVVDFLEGDPDRPIITGRVYNDDEMPPYELPDNQTQSGVKSRSTKQGTPENFNELRFEDKKDEEEIYFHAEKDFTRIVENNDVLKIGFEKEDPGDQTTEICNDQTITIGNNRAATIEKGDDDIEVSQGDHSINVKAGQSTIEAAKKITLKVGGSSVTIEPSKITIKAPQITIQGDATADLKSAMTTVEGSGMTTVKGGLVKIN